MNDLVSADGLDEPAITQLVHRFYEQVRDDALLGPIFGARVHDWDDHMARMCRFWSSILLRTGTYQGQPMRLHQVMPIDAQHFDHWLALFRKTAEDVLTPAGARNVIGRAERIARNLESGVAVANGVMLGPDDRYVMRG